MTLRIDIDRGRRPLTIGRLCWLLRRSGYRVGWYSQTRSPSGHGWHLEIQTVPDVASAVEVTALQVICGSDSAREACNLTRARRVDAGTLDPYWRRRWNVLYGT
jgi:hypothetical protein